MCLKINNADFAGYSWRDVFSEKPMAGYLIHKTLEFRNASSGTPGAAIVVRRVFAEIFFATAAVVAVADGVTRVAIGLIALIPALICCGPQRFDKVVVFTAISAVLIPELVLRCLLGGIASPINCDNIEMEDMEICVINFGQPEGVSIFGGSEED
ncbi:MAG: hypothetical protein ACHQT8_00335 [Chlamydiales bacterium]